MIGWADFCRRSSPNDLVIITADHGNDPTFRGTDHTREEVPLFVLHENEARDLGTRETFADVAATLADFFQSAGAVAGRVSRFLPCMHVPTLIERKRDGAELAPNEIAELIDGFTQRRHSGLPDERVGHGGLLSRNDAERDAAI